MAARTPRPVWINLEYLSAEGWIDSHHGLPSPHPRLPLVKYFYFPGFTPTSGGLVIEQGLSQARNAFQHDPAAVAAFCRALNIPTPGAGALRVSLFCYENDALPALIEAWRSGPMPILCIVPEGTALAQISRIVNRPLAAGSRFEFGRLTVAPVPFVELDQYDRLLWMCDVNFVRGEDSFVRAQLAARPLVWQAYPQEEGAHLRKAVAFMERYAGGLAPDIRVAWCGLMEAWNRQSPDAGRLWEPVAAGRKSLAAHAEGWAERLIAGGNLASALAKFCEERI